MGDGILRIQLIATLVVSFALWNGTLEANENFNSGPTDGFPADTERSKAYVTESAEMVRRYLEKFESCEQIEKSQSILIFPNIGSIAVGLGFVTGEGILVMRNQNGFWSRPKFISLRYMTAGLELKFERMKVIQFFSDRQRPSTLIQSVEPPPIDLMALQLGTDRISVHISKELRKKTNQESTQSVGFKAKLISILLPSNNSIEFNTELTTAYYGKRDYAETNNENMPSAAKFLLNLLENPREYGQCYVF